MFDLSNITGLVSPGQRKAAFVAAGVLVVLLLAAIGLLIASASGALHPTPTTEAQLAYVQAQKAESKAVAAARAQGKQVSTDFAVIATRANLVLAELDLGQVATAAKRAKKLAHDNQTNAWARYAYASVLETQKKTGAATDEFGAALNYVAETEPELRRSILVGYGHGLLKRGEKPEALDALTQAARIQPASPDLYEEAGDLALKLKLYADAATDYYSARVFDPNDADLNKKISAVERAHAPEAQKALAAVEESLAEGQ
jgi:tetratricopeptide (TPR) repeat protein